MAVPYQIFIFYGSIVSLVYLATDGFKNNAPFVFTLPPCSLGLITFTTHMPNKKKVTTAVFLFLLAAGLYLWSESPKKMELAAVLIILAHVTYLASFFRSIRRWWLSLSLITGILLAVFLYATFADLFRSFPLLIVLLSMSMAILSFSFICAGSLWMHGSVKAYDERPSLIRFVGMLSFLVFNTALLSSHFGRHHAWGKPLMNGVYYSSIFLLYYSNERSY